MKKIVFLFSSFLFFFFGGNAHAVFKPVANLRSIKVKRVFSSVFDKGNIFAASDNSLFKLKEDSSYLQRIAVFKDEQIQHVFSDPHMAGDIYVVTARHVYKLDKNLKKIYSAIDGEEIYTAVKYRGDIYIGTDKGLKYSNESILAWKAVQNLSNSVVYSLEARGDKLYLATDEGVYLLKDKEKPERLLVLRKSEDQEDANLTAIFIKLDIFYDNIIWLGTTQGLFMSQDYGENWEKFYLGGTDRVSVNCITQTSLQDDAIYLGTDKGLFVVKYKEETSKEMFEGLYSSYINWIDFTSKGKIFVATNKGLFTEGYFSNAYASTRSREIFENEPTIAEIQQAAMYYNEVSPEKIARWRNQLKYRGLLPSLNLNYDKTIYGTAGTQYYDGKTFIGPRDWGVSFSWDIADLVWNNYEDDVDTRARLNTQIRLDIIDEINRVYFERLRLKSEIKSFSFSEEELFNKELRLLELTAILDGYTGGYFSKRRKELSEN